MSGGVGGVSGCPADGAACDPGAVDDARPATGAGGASAGASLDPEVLRRGWALGQAPNGRLLPSDLGGLDEDALLGPQRSPRLYAVGCDPADYHPEREPLILVHGIRGDPKDLQAVADRFRDDDRYQVFVLAYDDFHTRTGQNGEGFADQLRWLRGALPGPDRELTIVAHSMGGIVTRRALNDMALSPERGLDRYSGVRVVAVDTPWHGFDGPADDALGAIGMAFVRPFMPDGLEDMRAASSLFRGDPGSRDPSARPALSEPLLPGHVSIEVVFAATGSQALDYTEGALAGLPQTIVDQVQERDPAPPRDPAVANFWQALIASSQFPAFRLELEDLDRRGALDAAAVRGALERHFPRFPGDHVSVLREQPRGGRSLLDHLEARLGRR